MIPKSDLIIGRSYCGDSRNTGKAVWTGKLFIYQRKCEMTHDLLLEELNHPEDDAVHDVFTPTSLVPLPATGLTPEHVDSQLMMITHRLETILGSDAVDIPDWVESDEDFHQWIMRL